MKCYDPVEVSFHCWIKSFETVVNFKLTSLAFLAGALCKVGCGQ